MIRPCNKPARMRAQRRARAVAVPAGPLPAYPGQLAGILDHEPAGQAGDLLALLIGAVLLAFTAGALLEMLT